MDLGAGLRFHHYRLSHGRVWCIHRVTLTVASSEKNTANGSISRSWAHPGGSYPQALPVAINLDRTA